MDGQIGVTVTSFGQGRARVPLPERSATVGDVLRLAGVELKGRRVAVNGRGADATTEVVEGDQVSVVPRVVGG